MADNNLNINITGSSAEFDAAAKRAVKAFKQLQDEQADLARAFITGTKSADQFETELRDLQRQAGNYAKSMQLAANATQGVGKGAKVNATPALQEFSRVIQDAPYGIQGVSNNIQQLTAQFGYLATAAGGPRAALSAMVGSLMGPAGVLLAVSVVTSALVSFGPQIYKFITGSKTAKERTDELTESLKKQYQAQKDARDGFSELTTAQKNYADTIGQIFGDSAEDIYEEKRKFDDAYLRKLQDDKREVAKIVRETAQKATDELAKGWRADEDLLEQLKIQNQEANKELIKLREEIAEQRQKIADDEAAEDLRRIEAGTEAVEKANAKKLKSDKAYLAARKKAYEANPIFGGGLFDEGASFANAFTGIETFEQAMANTNTSAMAFGQNVGFIKDSWTQAGSVFRDIGAEMTEFGEQFAWISDDVVATSEELGQKLEQSIEGGIAAAVTGMTTILAGGFQNAAGAMRAVGSLLLDTVGNIAIQLGTYAIGIGIAIDSIKGALASLNGGLAIAAGVALLALGASFKAFSSNLSKSGGGGSSVAGAGSAGGGNFQGASTAATGSVQTGGRYVFEIEGTKLVGVLSNTLARNRSLGTNLNLI